MYRIFVHDELHIVAKKKSDICLKLTNSHALAHITRVLILSVPLSSEGECFSPAKRINDIILNA